MYNRSMYNKAFNLIIVFRLLSKLQARFNHAALEDLFPFYMVNLFQILNSSFTE